MNIKLVSSVCVLNLCYWFYIDFVVSKRSSKEVQIWTSFGLPFDTSTEDTNHEEEFVPNREYKAEFGAINERVSGRI